MFGIVANILVGLLKSLYGLSASVVASAVNLVVQGTLIVRQPGGTAGTNELQVSHDGTNAVFKNPTVISTSYNQYNFLANSGTNVVYVTATINTVPSAIGTGQATDLTLQVNNISYFRVSGTGHCGASQNGAIGFFTTATLGSNGTVSCDTALTRLAAGVFGVTNWLQNSAGNLALASNFTDATGTLTNTNFSFPVISGRTYKITGFIAGNDSTGVDGFQMDFNGGAATASAFLLDMESMGFGTVVLGVSASAALATALTATTFTNGRLRLTGYLVASSTGTIIVRMAQNAHTAGTLTVNAGTWINLEDMRAV